MDRQGESFAHRGLAGLASAQGDARARPQTAGQDDGWCKQSARCKGDLPGQHAVSHSWHEQSEFNWSRGLVGIARITLGLRWTDPQCGFKALRGSVAQDLARRGFLDGFAFDLELLYLARCDSLRCEEVAVGWVDRPGSKVRPAVDVPGFLRDILRIRFHAWRGDYAAPARDHRSASRAIDAASSPRGATGIDAQDRAAHPSSRSSERRRAPSTS